MLLQVAIEELEKYQPTKELLHNLDIDSVVKTITEKITHFIC